MNDVIIRAERLGKKYRIRHQKPARYTALRDVIADRVRSLFSAASHGGPDESVEDFWALKDVGFEIRKGEVVGVIGRNGAGKSTLLKILSRITEPSEGRVELDGRVASLLEVGTGFHPELTGRENIFLNGSILGMPAADIRRRFDEIVAFADVERFLDTPVKRYSSGMYVRLAFAVAAHMEPEILIVDEVLAVGDAEFQKKCIGKMQDVSRGGRTVIFVSHNMAAIKSLTSRAMVLAKGRVELDGSSEEAIAFYTRTTAAGDDSGARKDWGKGTHTRILDVRMVDSTGATFARYEPGAPLNIEVVFTTDGRPGLSVELFLADERLAKIGIASSHQLHGISVPASAGTYKCTFGLEPLWLASGRYSIDVMTSVVNSSFDHRVESALEFEVPFANPRGLSWDFKQSYGYGAQALMCVGNPVFTRMADPQ